MLEIVNSEIGKIFKNKKILLFVFFIVLYEIIQCKYEAEGNLGRISESDKAYLKGYYKEWGGKLDKKKNNSIEGYKRKIDEAYNSDDYNRLINKQITIDEYHNLVKKRKDLTKQKHIFDRFYGEYLYVSKDNSRSLIDTDVWEYILSRNNVDYLLVILLIVITIQIFDNERGSIKSVVIATVKGRRNIAISKILVATFITIFLGLLVEIVMLITLTLSGYSFDGHNVSLQSIMKFAEINRTISIRSTYIITVVYKIMGYIYVSNITMFLYALFEKSNIVFGVTILMILAPVYIYDDLTKLMHVPLPIGMMMGTYFWIDTTRIKILIPEIIMALLVVLNYYCYVNSYKGYKK